MKTLTIPNCPLCGTPMLMLTGIPFVDEHGVALIAGPAKEYKYGCAKCSTYTTIPNERLQRLDPAPSEATDTPDLGYRWVVDPHDGRGNWERIEADDGC